MNFTSTAGLPSSPAGTGLGALTDAEAASQLRTKFFDRLCSADRDIAFYVGNQAARPQAFSIGGIYAPQRRVTCWA